MKVKNRTKILVGILLVAVAALVAGIFGGLFSGRDALDGITDIDTLRVKLKEKVSSGELTEVQAQFRLAEAKAVASVQARQRQRPELTAEQRSMEAELRAQVERGELTREEARGKWDEAMEKAETAQPGEEER